MLTLRARSVALKPLHLNPQTLRALLGKPDNIWKLKTSNSSLNLSIAKYCHFYSSSAGNFSLAPLYKCLDENE